MEISAAIPIDRAQALPPSVAKPTPEQAKLHESCKQFEAIIWRSVLEKSNASMLGGEDSSCDKTGTYQYFINNSLANSVSTLPSSFSSILYSQLSSHLPNGSAPTNPS